MIETVDRMSTGVNVRILSASQVEAVRKMSTKVDAALRQTTTAEVVDKMSTNVDEIIIKPLSTIEAMSEMSTKANR